MSRLLPPSPEPAFHSILLLAIPIVLAATLAAFLGRSRLERRSVLSTLAVLAVLQVGLAGLAELVPVRRLVHQGDTYTIHRGHSFFLNVFPLLGPVYVLGGHHRLTIQPKSGATRVEIVDLLEDLARDYPFLFVQQGPIFLLK